MTGVQTCALPISYQSNTTDSFRIIMMLTAAGELLIYASLKLLCNMPLSPFYCWKSLVSQLNHFVIGQYLEFWLRYQNFFFRILIVPVTPIIFIEKISFDRGSHIAHFCSETANCHIQLTLILVLYSGSSQRVGF